MTPVGQTFPSLEVAVRCGFSLFRRSANTYIVRQQTTGGTVVATAPAIKTKGDQAR